MSKWVEITMIITMNMHIGWELFLGQNSCPSGLAYPLWAPSRRKLTRHLLAKLFLEREILTERHKRAIYNV